MKNTDFNVIDEKINIQIYNPIINAYIDDLKKLIILIDQSEFKIDLNELKAFDPTFTGELKVDDSVLLEVNIGDFGRYLFYVINNMSYICYESDMNENIDYDLGFHFKIQNYTEWLNLKKIGVSSIGLYKNNELIHVIDGFLNNNKFEELLDLRPNFNLEEFFELHEVIHIAKIQYLNKFLFVYFDRKTLKIKIKRVNLDVIFLHENINITMPLINNLEINYEQEVVNVKLSSIKVNSAKKIFNFNNVPKIKGENILGYFKINNVKYFIFQKSTGIFLGKNNAIKATGYNSKLKLLLFKDSFYFIGRHTHYAYNAADKYNSLYLHNNENKVSYFKRFFPKIPLLKRFGYFKVKIEDLQINDRIHNNFYIGNDEFIIHDFKMKFNDKKVKTKKLKINKDNTLVHIIRTNLHGNMSSTILPYSEEYTQKNRFKIFIAEKLSKFSRKNVNLYFEKKSMKADESSYRVFCEVMKRNSTKKNYFVISKESEHYPKLKEMYGKNIIEKYSFKHFLSIFKAHYLI